MLDATRGGSRTRRLRSLTDKGRLSRGPTYRRSRRTRVQFASAAVSGLWPSRSIAAVPPYLTPNYHKLNK